jgi:hypothetical protein
MPLQFLNPSRHYNASSGCVRFRGYDAVFEILFDVEAGALVQLNARAEATEASLLSTFDANRELIERVACAQYLRTVENPYRLTAAHFAAKNDAASRAGRVR